MNRTRSTKMQERLNQEIPRRTCVVRVFRNEASCLRLVRAIAAETDQDWLDGGEAPEHGKAKRGDRRHLTRQAK
ncbi:MAG: transposase [Armatimonadetes bacterium]|nr:transposase [Armatimonadota bacterium]